MKIVAFVCAVLATFLAAGERAHAALYTYDFVATVGAMADDPGNVHFNFKTGDQITFSFTLTDDPSQSFIGFTINGVPGNFGGFQDVVISDPSPDADPSTSDFLQISAAGPQAPSIFIKFASAGDSAFDAFSGAFPPVLDPTRFDEAFFEYHIALDSVFANGTFDRIAPVAAVPEPAAVTIFGTALLALVVLTRFRRREDSPHIAD